MLYLVNGKTQRSAHRTSEWLPCDCELVSYSISTKEHCRKDGLKVVVYAMENHQDDATVQQNGCRAFANLLPIDSSWAKAAAADYGGIRRVMSAMNNHPFHAEIQKNGCYFFARLSSAHQEYRNKVIEANVAASIAEALRIHIGNEQAMSAVRQALTAITGA
jgi:hypothetical protein